MADLAAKLTINPNYMYKMYMRVHIRNATAAGAFIRMHIQKARVQVRARESRVLDSTLNPKHTGMRPGNPRSSKSLGSLRKIS